MNMPMTGITKNPMKPSSAPTRSRALTANTAQAVVVPTSRVQTKMAPSTRIVPGSTGTMMPAMPTAIAMEMRISVGLTGHSLQDVVREVGRGHRTAPESVSGAVRKSQSGWGGGCGRCGSGLAARGGGVQLVGLVVDGRGDLAELLAVLAGVVRAEEQLAAGLELHPEVGLGAAAVAGREDGLGGCGGSGHVSLISVFIGVWPNVASGTKIPCCRFRFENSSSQSRHTVPRWRCPQAWTSRCGSDTCPVPTLDRTMRVRGQACLRRRPACRG